MLIFALTGLINFITSIFLGFLVFSKRQKIETNKIFSLFCLSIAVWGFSYFFWQISNNGVSALFWVKALMAGAILMPITYFHFIVSFLKVNKKNKFLIISGYLLSFVFLYFDIMSSLFVESVGTALFFSFWPRPGILFHPFLALFFLSFIYSWYLLFKSFKRADETCKKQIQYLLIGSIVGFLGGSTNYFLWYGIPIPPYGSILLTFFVTVTAFAIIKYHLFQIKLILTEFLIGGSALILLLQVFVALSLEWLVLDVIIFILFCFFGYYLIRSISNESKRREEAEAVAERERELRRKAETLAAELKRLDDAKTQFLLSTQHHLRSPLSVVQGYLSMINEGSYGKIPAKVKEKIDASLQATQKLIHLVNDLLDVAQFQMNKGAVAKESTDVINLIGGVVADLGKSAQLKNIYLRFEKPSLLAASIFIDARGIKEAIYNIVDNAIKYTQEGGVVVSVVVTGERLLISVADTGIGMDENDRQGLFNRTFERGEKAKNVNVNGKGIGLYLAAQMIMSNGGTISAKSEGWGKGTEFIIELPMGNGQESAGSILPPVPACEISGKS